MSNFEWQTGESEKWEESGEGSAGDQPLVRWRGRLALAGLLVLALVAAGLALRLERQVETVESSAAGDVLASYELLRQAEAAGDLELFQLLRVNDPLSDWEEVEDGLLAAGLLLDRRPFGLAAQPAETGVVEVRLAPDLQSAQLALAQPYTVLSNGDAPAASLRHLLFFQRQGSAWRLAPPPESYWGQWRQWEGRFLTLAYSQPEAALAPRLAGQLDELLARLCAGPELGCPAGFRLQLHLRREPDSLLEWAMTPQATASTGSSITQPELALYLPSPALVGLPMDEAGFDALTQAYAVRVIRGILLHPLFVGDGLYWGQSQGFYQATRTRLLVELGLRPWPASGLESQPTPPPLPWPEQAVALLCTAGRQAELYAYQPATDQWSSVTAVGPYDTLSPVLEGEGLLLQTQSYSEASGPVMPPLFIWPNGRLEQTPPMPWAGVASLRSEPPYATGQYLVTYLYGGERGLAADYYLLDLAQCRQGVCQWRLIPGRPVWSPDSAHLIMAVEGEGQLLLSDGGGQVFKPVGAGFLAFWLDDATFGYRRFVNPATGEDLTNAVVGQENAAVDLDGVAVEVVVASTSDVTPRPLLRTSDLLAALPEKGGLDALWINYVGRHPADPNLVLVSAIGRRPQDAQAAVLEHQDYYFLLDRRNGTVTPAPEVAQVLSGQLSADGRFLAGSRVAEDRASVTITWRELATGHTGEVIYWNPYELRLDQTGAPAHQSLAWSADGRWLLALVDGLLIFLSPEYDYQYVVAPARPGCYAAAWVSGNMATNDAKTLR